MRRSKISDQDRLKAAFLTEYRALCKKYGVMVVHLENEDGYCPFAVGITGEGVLDQAILEMTVEDLRRLVLNEVQE